MNFKNLFSFRGKHSRQQAPQSFPSQAQTDTVEISLAEIRESLRNSAKDIIAVRDLEHDTAEKAPEMQKIPKVETAAYSHIGTRNYQQDSAFVSPSTVFSQKGTERILAVLCDGMGGLSDGGKASEIAVETIKQDFQKIYNQQDCDIPAFYRSEIQKIDEAVCRLGKGKERYNAGTTFISVILEKGIIFLACVGDSRIYLIRSHQIYQITREHNYFLQLKERVEAGELTMEEAKSDPRKDALISYLGMDGVKLMDVVPRGLPLHSGDLILLCSDGLTKELSDSEILEIVDQNTEDLGMTARYLALSAFDKDLTSKDNTTVILVRYTE